MTVVVAVVFIATEDTASSVAIVLTVDIVVTVANSCMYQIIIVVMYM